MEDVPSLLLLLACAESPTTGAGEPDSIDDISDIDPDTLPQGASPCREPVLAEVTEVIDGDTLWARTAAGSEKIRLIGLDTPELGWDGDASECYAEEAAAFTAQALTGQWVWLTFDGTCEDIYGRTLAYVLLGAGDQDFFQRLLLRGGYAWDYPWTNTDTFADTFSSDEQHAQSLGEGLWSACL